MKKFYPHPEKQHNKGLNMTNVIECENCGCEFDAKHNDGECPSCGEHYKKCDNCGDWFIALDEIVSAAGSFCSAHCNGAAKTDARDMKRKV